MKRTNRKSDSPFGPRGSTLIELLVVVSIISLLVSILLPALKKAREQAKSAMCTANAKGIATAGLVYAEGNSREQFIPAHPLFGKVPFPMWCMGAYTWGGKSGAGEAMGGGRDPGSSLWGTSAGRGPATRPLNDVLFKRGFADFVGNPGPNQANWKDDMELDLPVFRCPSDRGYSGYHFRMWKRSRLSSYDHYGTSYTAGVLIRIIPPGSLNGLPDVLVSHSSFLQTLSRVVNPANTIAYMENVGRVAWHINRPRGVCLGVWSNLAESDVVRHVEGWHGRPFHFVASFVDGHATTVKMKGHQIPPPRLSHYPDSLGFACPAADFPRFYECWRCSIIRGPGWQLDTLPAAIALSEAPSNMGIVDATTVIE